MWDHNTHYHQFLLGHIPSGAGRALDVGCGSGHFARRVAERVPEVVAVDRDTDVVNAARTARSAVHVQYLESDIMDAEVPLRAFDFVSCIATLHHMPLQAGLERLRSFVAPGGVLLGLYKPSTSFDYTYTSLAGLVDLAVGVVRHGRQPDTNGVILAEPRETLSDIRTAARTLLPGATLRRHIYHRYSLVYSR